jgi:hypothetical protein
MLFYSGFVLLGVLFAIVTVGCVFAICVRLALAQTTVKRPGAWTVFSFVLYSVGIIAVFRWINRPSIQFERQFAFPPPADVLHLSAQTDLFGDSGYCSLSFEANQQTVNRIVVQRGMNQMEATEVLQHFGRDDTPGLNFSSETEDLFYKPGTGEVTYEWTGYD